MSAGAIERRGKRRVLKLRIDGLRLRLAWRVLPERFRARSAGYWLDQLQRETAQIEASTKEITELTEWMASNQEDERP